MRISLIIPTLWVKPEENIVPALISMSDEYDELIIIDDVDLSLAKKINKGLKRATGEYLIVSNDDLTLKEGSLRDLVDPSLVISPRVEGSIDKLFHGHMFCISRNTYNKVGGFDEEYSGAYWIDSDYWMQLVKNECGPAKSSQVTILHDRPATTLKVTGDDTKVGRERFIQKWGEEGLRIVV